MKNFKLIGVPVAFNKLFSTGAEKAPQAIRKTLGIDFPDLKLNSSSRESAGRKIRKKAEQVFNSGEKPFFIGGDHSITLPILEAQDKPFDVFWFDAHPDAYDTYGGTKINHATVLRRVSELPKCRNIYLIGCRTGESEEKEFLRKNKKVKKIKEYEIKKMHSGRYYITIDIDVLDPKDAPAVDWKEPKGMRIDPLLKCIKNLRKGNLIGADLVEFVPDNDSTGITEKSISRIIAGI